MSCDSLSKHVILIAIVYILGYVLYLLAPVTTGFIMIISEDEPGQDDYASVYNLISFGFYTLMAIFAALMIAGVVKKRRVLIAPWLVLSSLGFVALILIFIMNFLVESDIFINLAFYLQTLALQILIIYPTYTLYMKLRSQDEAMEKKLKAADQVMV